MQAPLVKETRARRSAGMPKRFTGNATQKVNSIFQQVALKFCNDGRLEQAHRYMHPVHGAGVAQCGGGGRCRVIHTPKVAAKAWKDCEDPRPVPGPKFCSSSNETHVQQPHQVTLLASAYKRVSLYTGMVYDYH